MTYREKLELYSQGKLDEQEKIEIEKELEKQRRTAIITVDPDGVITSYEEKPKEPKSSLAVPPFYYYLARDVKRIPEALAAGCGYDAPGSFAAWLSGRTTMKAYRMPGKRYDIGRVRKSAEPEYVGDPRDWAFAKRLAGLQGAVVPEIAQEYDEMQKKVDKALRDYPYMDEFEYMSSKDEE